MEVICMEYKELDRQLEIRIDIAVMGTKHLPSAFLEGKIEAYKDIRGLIKDFPSLVKEEVEA